MNEFSIAKDADFSVLQQRCQNTCVVFVSRRMPPGCLPSCARVGFEIDVLGNPSLFVDQGVSYSGSNAQLARLFQDGVLQFGNFDALKSFLRTDVREAFATTSAAPSVAAMPVVRAPSPTPTPVQAPMPEPEAITDMTAVSATLQGVNVDRQNIDVTALAESMKTHVIGQDDAISVLAGMVARHVTRVEPRRPASVFLVGPTGVGKTKAAKALAECLEELDAPHAFLRLDMCEYQEKHRVSQLLGAPQGYVGYAEGAQLLLHLATHPNSLVLFDEIEKAHPDVFRTLMNAMDSGRLSSPNAIEGSHEIDCRQAIFVFTSNIAARELLAAVDMAGDPKKADALCRKHLTRHGVPPELVGRIGAFSVFHPLSDEHRARIMVQAINVVAREYGVEVEWVDPEVVIKLLRETNGDFGVRPDEQTVDRVFGTLFADARTNRSKKLRLDEYPA